MRSIKTRRQAAEAGENKYYTGTPCSKGHDSMRYTSSGICCKCNMEGVKAYNRKMQRLKSAGKIGTFFYDLHPDDHAAALAYCQALDLARGRAPHVPETRPSSFELPEAIAQHRANLIVANSAAAPSYLPEP